MSCLDRIEIDSLRGEVLTHIDIDEVENEILLTTKSGRKIKIYHQQDCCELVAIESTDGSWEDIVGKVIVEALQVEIEGGEPKPEEYSESWTRTTITLRVDDATVISRWIGKSNGYYSESVNIEDVTNVLAKAVKP